MSEEQRDKFAVGFDCADGRTKEPVLAWARKNLSVKWVDLLTRAGMDGSLPDVHPVILEDYKNQLSILLEKHGSKHILVVGHCACAGNPVSGEEHRQCVVLACEVVRLWHLPKDVEVIGLLVNEQWEVEVVS